jgi:ribonuclease HI
MAGGTLVLFTDGAARGNPGPAGIGMALYRLEGGRQVEISAHGEAIGSTTNNVAEYRALLLGLEEAARHEPDMLIVCADSQLLVRQLQGSYRVKAKHLQPLHGAAMALLGTFRKVRLQHVPREENLAADALANAALDAAPKK